MVILDTSILIDHLRTTSPESILLKTFRNHPNQTFAISVVTIQELYEGQSTKDQAKENQLLSLLSLFEVLPYNYEVAQTAGKIARDQKQPIELADAAIAATTIIADAQLLTLNTKHFVSIPGLSLFKP